MTVLWGHHSPQMLQKVMALLSDDLELHKQGMLDVHAIDKPGGIGSKGQHANNCWRDLKTLLPVPKLPKLHRLLIPMRHCSIGKFVNTIPMLLPHQLFAAIYEHYQLMWENIICEGQPTLC